MEKIVRLSRLVNVLVIILAFAHISITLLAIFDAFDAAQSGANMHWLLTWLSFSVTVDDTSIAQQLNEAGLHSVFWMSLPSLIFYTFAYANIFFLFSEYQRQQIFSSKAIDCIKRLGIALLLWPLFNLIYYPLLLVFLRVTGQLEQATLTVEFGTDDLMQIGAACIVIVVAWIMKEANKLQQEQELTI